MTELKVIARSRRMSPLAALSYLEYHMFLQERKLERLQRELEEAQNAMQAIGIEMQKREEEMKEGKEDE